MNALEIVAGVATITQALANIGLSMSDLARQIKRAESEGREFGEQDVEELRMLAVSQLDQLDAWIAANKRNIQSGGNVDSLIPSLKRAVVSRAMMAESRHELTAQPCEPLNVDPHPIETEPESVRVPPRVPANMAAHADRAGAVLEE